jgi:hypothetical protein
MIDSVLNWRMAYVLKYAHNAGFSRYLGGGRRRKGGALRGWDVMEGGWGVKGAQGRERKRSRRGWGRR